MAEGDELVPAVQTVEQSPSLPVERLGDLVGPWWDAVRDTGPWFVLAHSVLYVDCRHKNPAG